VLKKLLLILVSLAIIAGANYWVFKKTRSNFYALDYSFFKPADVKLATVGFPTWGASSAPVTIVSYSDFECRFSPKMDTLLDSLKTIYGPEKLRIVYKERPLAKKGFYRLRCQAALAAQKQNKFFEMKTLLRGLTLSEDEKVREGKLMADIHSCVKTLELDSALFMQDMFSPGVTQILDETSKETNTYGLYSLPTIVIDGHAIVGAVPIEKILSQINPLLAQSSSVAASGTPEKQMIQ
jgi:protein-disulfide isomerase